MDSFKTFRVGFASWAMLLVAVSQAAAQPYTYLWDGGSGANNFWDLGPNWNVGTSGQANNAVPYAYYQEMGSIGNATFPGPYTVHVRRAQNLFVPFSMANNERTQTAGVTVDLGSTLNIQSTGVLKVIVTNGTGTETGLPTPGTGNATVSGSAAITIQSGGRLEVEDNVDINSGTLTVFPGGTVTAQNIGSAAQGAIVLSGNATLTSTGSTTLGGRTTITGPSVVFSSGEVVMNDTTVFNPVVTGASHTIMNVNGPVTMNGTLRPQFQSVTPTLGSTWVIWDSTATGGAFDVSDDSLTDLPTGHRYAIMTTPGVTHVNGTRGVLTVENFLTAEVNRANGQVTLRNTASTGGVTIDGYQITSAASVLNPSAFTSSLDDDNFDGGEWVEANLTAGTIGELNAGGNSLIATSSSNALGNIYNPIPTLQQFGDPVPEDLVLTYRRSDGRFVTGEVQYINDGIDNTLVLQVDPTDGKARIINDSTFNAAFDGYRVRSASNSLNTTWDSLDDQNVGGAGGWLEAPVPPTAGALSELNPLGSLAVSAGAAAAVMTGLFNFATGTQDLLFDFRIPPGGGLPNGGVLNGVVRYASFNVGLDGDYNGDGRVDAADYVVWRKTDGTPAGFNLWRANFGNMLGSGAGAVGSSQVPEPSMFVLALILTCGLLGTRCRSNCLVTCQPFAFVSVSPLGGLV